MTTPALMRCSQAHWLGDKFVPAGTVLPAGHPEAIEAFFDPMEIEEPPAKTSARKSSN